LQNRVARGGLIIIEITHAALLSSAAQGKVSDLFGSQSSFELHRSRGLLEFKNYGCL
jgi:hypothetical protein